MTKRYVRIAEEIEVTNNFNLNIADGFDLKEDAILSEEEENSDDLIIVNYDGNSYIPYINTGENEKEYLTNSKVLVTKKDGIPVHELMEKEKLEEYRSLDYKGKTKIIPYKSGKGLEDDCEYTVTSHSPEPFIYNPMGEKEL